MAKLWNIEKNNQRSLQRHLMKSISRVQHPSNFLILFSQPEANKCRPQKDVKSRILSYVSRYLKKVI